MKFMVGETVRVTRGDLRGRTGIIRRIPINDRRGSPTYGVEFSGEGGVSSFRGTNLESAPANSALPEFMVAGNFIHLLADEPYELISGGLMGKRRRYQRTEVAGLPPFGMTDDDTDACDFRRFPVELGGVVVAGLWSRFEPRAGHIKQVLGHMERARGALHKRTTTFEG